MNHTVRHNLTDISNSLIVQIMFSTISRFSYLHFSNGRSY